MTHPANPIPERMDNKIALHTAARRYCEDRFSEWTQTYADLQAKEKFQTENLFKPGRDDSQEAYGIFPRYRFDKATMMEVERLVPHSSKSLEELRSQLIAASDIAESLFHAELNNNRRGISRVFEVHAFGPREPDYAIELSIFDPAYFWGGEQYCTAAGVDRVGYASHESSITVGENWLTEMFKEKWPEMRAATYLGPYSTNDLRGTWKSERADET